MAKRGKCVEHNRLLLTFNMMKGGMNVLVAWREAGKKIARSKAQMNRKRTSGAQQREFVNATAKRITEEL